MINQNYYYFNKYKYNNEPEAYVLANMSKRKRSIIAQFRSGVLPLMIETGRFRGIEVQSRICPACRGNVEDEFHFLIQCTAYQNSREVLYQKISENFEGLENMDDLEKFIFININCQMLVGSFLLSAWEQRKMYLYED
jgi:dihydroorotate dehydrogenase